MAELGESKSPTDINRVQVICISVNSVYDFLILFDEVIILEYHMDWQGVYVFFMCAHIYLHTQSKGW